MLRLSKAVACLLVAVPLAIAAQPRASYSAPGLMEGPGIRYSLIRRLKPREPVRIHGERDNWLEVTTGNGERGWVRETEIIGR